MTELNQRLSQTRRARKLRQHQVAEHLDVSLGAVSQWEQGKTKPNMRNLVLLAKLLNVSLDWLLSGVETVKETQKASYSSNQEKFKNISALSTQEEELLYVFAKLSIDWQGKVIETLQFLAKRYDDDSK
ncbi:MAG: helix-turn-helix domain-containing protein [Pseudomonadales bacterium]|jgi:repressor LexA